VLQCSYQTLTDACLAWEHAMAAGTVGDPTVVPSTLLRTPVLHILRTPIAPCHLGGCNETKPSSSPMVLQQPSPPMMPTRSLSMSTHSPYPSPSRLVSPLCACLLTAHTSAECASLSGSPILYLSAPVHPLTNEELYWVVMEGNCPDIYLGR